MRKNTSFAIAAAVLGFIMLVWAKSNVAATDAGAVRPKVGVGTYQVVPNASLPIQVIEPVW